MKRAAHLIMSLPILALAMGLATGANAEVFQKADNGFVIRTGADVTASPEVAWRTLIDPAAWWQAEHTYSGDAANLSLDPRIEGCFCEVLPGADGSIENPRGHVEHMRVIYTDRPRVLRLSGALGPLQSQALTGTLTINLKPTEGGGTRILWEYVVGGYMRFKVDEIAPAVDGMLGGQMLALARKLGISAPVAAPPAPVEPAPVIPAPVPGPVTSHPTEIGR